MHLDPLHGETWREIESDGFLIADRVPGRVPGDSLAGMAASAGAYMQGISASLDRQRPDIVLVLGDRVEMLAATLAAVTQNMVVAHLCGGSSSGSLDDSIRHAITKLAHVHLPALPEHARRIEQMGENPNDVHVVGLPGADLSQDATISRAEIAQSIGLPDASPYILVVQHPVTHSHAEARSQMKETLEAVVGTGMYALLANPNDDAGGRAIMEVQQEYAARHARLRILRPQANREQYASTMAHAAVQVGNSSSGILEAQSLGLPVVNIGERQRGREHLACALHAGHDRKAIRAAIDSALNDASYRSSLQAARSAFQKVNTPEAVRNVLIGIDLKIALKPKLFHDLFATTVPRPRSPQ